MGWGSERNVVKAHVRRSIFDGGRTRNRRFSAFSGSGPSAMKRTRPWNW